MTILCYWGSEGNQVHFIFRPVLVSPDCHIRIIKSLTEIYTALCVSHFILFIQGYFFLEYFLPLVTKLRQKSELIDEGLKMAPGLPKFKEHGSKAAY